MMKTVVHCAGCDRPILDRFIFNVLDLAWHAKCVKCADCKCHLSEKCFSREGKLYCRQDFFRRYGTKCSGCAQGISPNDLVRRAKSKVFHLKCFTCMVCRKQLSTGEELYVLDDNKFICKDDYINTRVASSVNLNSPEDHADLSDGEGSEPGSVLNPGPTDSDGGGGMHDGGGVLPNGGVVVGGGGGVGGGPLGGGSTPIDKDSSIDDGDSNHSGQHDGRENGTPDENTVGGKRRGPRTTIKAKQLETLKAAFAATPKPTRHIREQLATETGLNMRVIQVWFQNRRSKERRMKQLSTMGARRNFYRNPRRMRALRPGMSPDGTCGAGLDDPDMPPHHHQGGAPFAYFADGASQGDMYGSQPFYDFFPGQQHGLGHPGHPGPPDAVAGFPQSHLSQTSIEQPVPPGGPLAPGNLGLNHNDGHFLPPDMMVAQRNSSPDSVLNVGPHVNDGGGGFGGNGHPPRSVSSSVDNFASPPSLTHQTETPVW